MEKWLTTIFAKINFILRGLNTSLMVVETCYIRFVTLNYIKLFHATDEMG